MISKEYPKIAETVSRGTLPNGLGIVVIRKPNHKRVRAQLTVNCGSADRQLLNGLAVPLGTAHFLEHILFRLDDNAMSELTKGGTEVNAFTSPDITSFYIEGTGYTFRHDLSCMLRLVFNPFFDETAVDAEREIIKRELLMLRDDPEEMAFRGLMECLYADSPLRDDVAGTLESIESITADILSKYHRIYYTPSNAVLTVAGDLEPRLIYDIALNATPDRVSAFPPRDYGRDRSKYPMRAHCETNMDISAPVFLAGIKTAQCVDYKSMITAQIALDSLMGSASELYQRLYSIGLLNDSIDFSTEFTRAGCYITFGGESTMPYKTVFEILTHMEQYKPDDETVDRCKRAFYGQAVMNYDSFESICLSTARDWFDGGDVFELLEIINSIKADDVREFICKYGKPELCAASYIMGGGYTQSQKEFRV